MWSIYNYFSKNIDKDVKMRF